MPKYLTGVGAMAERNNQTLREAHERAMYTQEQRRHRELLRAIKETQNDIA